MTIGIATLMPTIGGADGGELARFYVRALIVSVAIFTQVTQ